MSEINFCNCCIKISSNEIGEPDIFSAIGSIYILVKESLWKTKDANVFLEMFLGNYSIVKHPFPYAKIKFNVGYYFHIDEIHTTYDK